MAEIVLYMSDYRMDALKKAMEEQGLGSVENHMQNYLIDFFTDTVPITEQLRIQKRMDAERQQKDTALERAEPSDTEKPEFRTKTRPLRAEEIAFEDDVLQFGNRLNFKFEPGISICELLGVPDDIWEPDGLANAYINYNLETEQPDDSIVAALSVDGQCSDTKDVRYPISAEEQAMLLPAMDAYCREKTGRSLAEYAVANRAAQSLDQERQPTHRKQNRRPER